MASSGPSPRAFAAMTHDPLRARTPPFGGGAATSFDDQLWQWDGVAWTQRTLAVRPTARGRACFTFDPRGGVALLTGGFFYQLLGLTLAAIAELAAPSPVRATRCDAGQREARGHGPLRRSRRFHGTCQFARCGGGARPPRPVLRARRCHHRRRRRSGRQAHRRLRHGGVRRAHRTRRRHAARRPGRQSNPYSDDDDRPPRRPASQGHIGLATGEVVASATGSTRFAEYTVTGETVNLASRLSALAAPGETIISEAIATAPEIDAEPAGRHAIKGFAEPVGVWRLQGLRAAAPGQRPLFGRRAELATSRLARGGARDGSWRAHPCARRGLDRQVPLERGGRSACRATRLQSATARVPELSAGATS